MTTGPSPSPEFADRALPTWYDEAKFGIFIHWGPYAVPCFAPTGQDMGEMLAAGNWEEVFRWSPYTEWYLNTWAIEGSATAAHHEATYGPAVTYADFIAEFRERSAGVDLDSWADLFAAAGARYVVPVTKHHDGWLMWDHDRDGRADVIGALHDAVRARGLRFGTYYSGGLDWTVVPPPIRNLAEMFAHIPDTSEYHDLVRSHVDDLIERFAPDVLWNDIGWPPSLDPNDTFRSYYARVPHGVVNDRFNMIATIQGRLHADFTTPEYSTTPRGTRKWEVCRGIGRSFGYNRTEDESAMPSADELVWMLCDIVSRGGNLLLNVGPTADGQIPLAQAARLLAVGWWLRINGEAIYATQPGGSTQTSDGHDVRLTVGNAATYAIVRGTVAGSVRLLGVAAPTGAEVRLVGTSRSLPWHQDDDALVVALPDHLPATPATAIAVSR
jgi:alpha-L-fucosidase